MPGDSFVDISWLIDHLDEPRLRIVDARNVSHGGTVGGPSGAEQYASGHLPGAIYLDYSDELADPATPYATRVAPADLFARTVGAKGIGDEAIVVAYDAGTVPFAARIAWNFRYYGHVDAYILAGGVGEWIAAGKPLTNEIPVFSPAIFTPLVQPNIRASRDEVLAVAEGRSPVQLIETQRDTTYGQRGRDIANAIRLSGSQLLEDVNGGRIADKDALDRLIGERHLDRGKRTIVSCGSGVAAAGSYFALKAAGFVDVAVYDGSWLEWEHDALPTVPKSPAKSPDRT
jgi:thiosulfate/3-mercaptopyruvate sulfurtransferase